MRTDAEIIALWTNDAALTLRAICDRLPCSRVDLVGIMASEANADPAAHNPGGATGLIQFDDWSNGLLRMPSGALLSSDQVKALDIEAQLREVEMYFHPYAHLLHTPGRMYTLCFIPASAVHAAFGPSFVVCGQRPGDPYASFYRANPAFDTTRKGYITGQDMADATARGSRKPTAQAILSAMAKIDSALAAPALAESTLLIAGDLDETEDAITPPQGTKW